MIQSLSNNKENIHSCDEQCNCNIDIIKPISYNTYTFKYFDRIEKICQSIIHKNFVNKVSSHIFTKILRFYYSNRNIEFFYPYYNFISIESIVGYIFDRILQLSKEQQAEIFNKIPQMKNTFNNSDKSFYTISISNDIVPFYQNDYNNIQILSNVEKYYNVKCTGIHNILYKSKSKEMRYQIKLAKFFSFKIEYESIPFLQINDPIIYEYNYNNDDYNETNGKIFIIEIEEGYLLINQWQIDNNNNNNDDNKEKKTYPPFIHIFKLLNTTNIYNIVNNCKEMNHIKSLEIPYMEKLQICHNNMDKIIEDIYEFKNIFLNIFNQPKPQNFNFTSVSHLENYQSSNIDKFVSQIENVKSSEYENHDMFTLNINNIGRKDEKLIVNNPYLFLIINKDSMITACGLYDYYQPKPPNNTKLDVIKF